MWWHNDLGSLAHERSWSIRSVKRVLANGIWLGRYISVCSKQHEQLLNLYLNSVDLLSTVVSRWVSTPFGIVAVLSTAFVLKTSYLFNNHFPCFWDSGSWPNRYILWYNFLNECATTPCFVERANSATWFVALNSNVRLQKRSVYRTRRVFVVSDFFLQEETRILEMWNYYYELGESSKWPCTRKVAMVTSFK